MIDEVEHHPRLLIADGNDFISLDHDTQWNGGVRTPRRDTLQVRNTQDDHEPALIHVVTRTLISIRYVLHEVVRHTEFLFQKLPIVIHWASYLHPAVWLPCINVLDAAIKIPECSHCCLLNLCFV